MLDKLTRIKRIINQYNFRYCQLIIYTL